MFNLFFGSNPQPEVHTEGFLRRWHSHLVTLQSIEDPKGRTQFLDKIGRSILSEGKDWKVNWRQFGLMHNASVIRYTDLEGGVIEDSIEAWHYFISKWEKGEGLFFTFDLTKQQFGALFAALEDLKFFQALLPGPTISALSDREVVQIAQKFQRALKERLAKRKRVYVPLGYRHGIGNEGHAIVCKIELQQDGHLSTQLLNLGNGSERHPILNYTTTQDKISFRYFPFEVEATSMWGKHGLTAVCHLIRYLTDPPDPNQAHYEGDDLLDIFYLLGKLHPTLGEHPERFEAKGQRSGYCSEKGVHNAIHDVLIDNEATQENIKRLFLNIKFGSLVAGYHSYRKAPCEKHRFLLRNAAEEIGVALQKIKPRIHEEEYLAGSAVIEAVLRETKKPCNLPLTQVQKQPSLLIPNFPATFPPINQEEISQVKPIAQTKSTTESTRNESKLLIPTFEMASFSNDLDCWCHHMRTLNRFEAYQFLQDCARVLPIPKWNEADVWDTIDEISITPVIVKLESLVKLGLKGNVVDYSRNFILDVLTIHTFYVIVDKLARKCPYTHLEEFASPFIPHIKNLTLNDFSAIPFGIENHRYAQISTYFKNGAEKTHDRIIFPIEPVLSIEQYVYESTHGGNWSQGTNHIYFLQGHLYAKYRHQFIPSSQLKTLYEKTWLKQTLPSEVNTLYYFAYLSSTLFYGEYQLPFPMKLNFETGVDSNGKKALLIQCDPKKTFERHPEEGKDVRSSYFQEMEEASYNPIPLSDPYYQQMTTNDAVCARLSVEDAENYKLSEPIYRDLLRITRKKNLQLPMAVHWASTNLIHLGHKDIRHRLHCCFFAPGALYHQLQEEPLYIHTLREMILKGLDYYGDNPYHISTLLFLLQVGIFFETHASALFNPQESQNQLRVYQDKLETLLQHELKKEEIGQIKLYQILARLYQTERSEEELIDLLKSLLHFDQLELPMFGGCWLRYREADLLRLTVFQIRDRLENNKDERNRVCNALFQDFFPEGVECGERQWEGHFPICYSEHYTLNFLERSLHHAEKGRLSSPRVHDGPPGWERLTQRYGEKFWQLGSISYNLAGSLRICSCPNDGDVYEREIDWNGEKRWVRIYQYLNWEMLDNVNLDFLSYDGYLHLTHYIFLDKKEGDPDILSFNYQLDRPVLRIDFVQSGMVISQTDAQGNQLPIQLVNLAEIEDKDHPIYRYVLRFAHPSHVLCFVNTETREIEEITFFRLRLRFTKRAEGLESTEFPGFYLLLTETLEELNHFQGALVLENGTKERKVILPLFELKSSVVDFTKTIEITRKLVDDQHFFTFDIDSINGALNHRSLKAHLYLALILKMQGDELKAMKHLKRIKSNRFLNNSQLNYLLKFTHLKDYSPIALAFNAQLFSFVIENFNLMLEERFSGNTEKKQVAPNQLRNQFFNWGQRAYADYLKAISQDHLSAIPLDLRLSYEEEKAILRALKERAEIAQQPFHHLLAIRYKLLRTQKRSVIATVTPKEIPMRAPILSSLLQPKELRSLCWISENYFPYGENRIKKAKPWEDCTLNVCANRIRGEAIEAEFPRLYEEAKTCPLTLHPFDYTLLACLKVKDSLHSDGRKLGHLLFYVRHFSQFFAHLSFKGAKTDAEKSLIFKKIASQVVALQDHPQYIEFVEEHLKENVTFDFSRKTRLKAPKTSHSSPPIVQGKRETKVTSPFRTLGRQLFQLTFQTPSLPPNPSFVDRELEPAPESLASEIHDRFKAGYEELKKRKTPLYHLKSGALMSVKEELKLKKEDYHLQLLQLRKRLINQTNKTYKIRKGKLATEQELHEELEYRLRSSTHQLLTILPETVMKNVVLTNNPQFLIDHCPLLTQDEIQQVMDEVCDYYYLLTCYQVCNDSLALIKKIKKEPKDLCAIAELGKLLEYEFLDPRQYPEIFYFKVTEGKLPRPDQVPIHKWVCESLDAGKKVCFQHQAGGGKTDYLTPLFMLRARRLGLMPVFLSAQTMYAVDKDNLSATLSKLDHELGYLELGLHMKISNRDFQMILEQLEQNHKEGRALMITPQTFYALALQYAYAGTKEQDEQRVEYIGKILHFFESRCLLLGDEAHRRFDPLTRAIFGVGGFKSLPKSVQSLILALVKPLLGYEPLFCEDGQLVSHVARMGKNLLETPSPEEIRMIQQTLALHMSQSKILNIPEAHQQEMSTYWIDVRAEQPSYLVELAKVDRKRAGLIALTGYFILNLIPQIVHLRTELDHSRSIFPEEEFDTPCHHKTPSTAQYEDSYLACALSIKGTSHRVLTESQMRKLITNLLDEDWKEQKELAIRETESLKLFKSWVINTPLQGFGLRDIALSNAVQMNQLTTILGRHHGVIEYYLLKFILPQIGHCTEQLTCTPAHLFNGFKQVIIFTATPLSRWIYPFDLADIRYDTTFEVEVISEFCKEKNQKKIFVDSPESFFDEVKEKYGEALGATEVFLDPKGFFCDSSNDEVARKWLEASPELDGILFFKEGRSLKVNKEEKICLMLQKKETDNPSNTILELDGSNIKEALGSHQLQWEKLHIGTYHDASHTESANIIQKIGTTAFIFVGDHLTCSRLIQALLRLRGLLDEKMIQNVVWVFTKDVAKKIKCGASGEIDGAAIYAWAIHNESEILKKQIMLNAFQEIDFQIEQYVWQELKLHLNDPKAQIAIMQKYANGLLEKKSHDLYASFAAHEEWKRTSKVLMHFATTQYAKYGFPIPFSQQASLNETIGAIIEKTSKQLKKIPVQWGREISIEVEQQVRLKKDIETVDFRPRPHDPISSEGIYGDFGVDQPDYDHYPFQQGNFAFNTKGLTNKLFFEQNQLRTAKNAGQSMETSYLKPIDFFMIIISKNGNWKAIAHCNEILSTDLKTLIKGTDDPHVKHKAFIVSAEGKLIQRGKKNLAPTEEMVKNILDSQEMQDLTIDAALLQGQIVHPNRLLQRIKQWKGFDEFWTHIVKAQPNRETANQRGMERLMGKSAMTSTTSL